MALCVRIRIRIRIQVPVLKNILKRQKLEPDLNLYPYSDIRLNMDPLDL